MLKYNLILCLWDSGIYFFVYLKVILLYRSEISFTVYKFMILILPMRATRWLC